MRAGVDLREQVVSFAPQSVITSDNLVVEIDTVIYFQVTEPKSAVYEIANYIIGVEQLTVTTLRNVVGTMDLEQTLTSRDQINGQLRGVLDEATGKWGIRVNRVELKTIEPPASIKDSMEKQMRAERDRRAAILTAEGVKQSAILTAEGDKQSAILKAEGSAQARILEAEGQSRAILQVFDAIHEGDADSKLLAYQYLQMLPEIAKSESSKIWFVPTEFTGALKAITAGFGQADEPTALKVSASRKSTAQKSALGDAGRPSRRPRPSSRARRTTRRRPGARAGARSTRRSRRASSNARRTTAPGVAPGPSARVGEDGSVTITRLASAADPGLEDYRGLTDVALRSRTEAGRGLYIAESQFVIERAIEAGHEPRSFLCSEKWLPAIEPLAAVWPGVPVLVGPDDLLEEVTGFHVHRGALAAMRRPSPRSVAEVIAGARRVAVLEDLVNHTNVGAVFRSAAAMGVDAVLVSPRCADPLYRR